MVFDNLTKDTVLEDYQKWVKETTTFKGSPDDRMEMVWAVIGLNSEAGEVAGEIEKILRKGEFKGQRLAKLEDELGDVLWYCAALCNASGLKLEDVIDKNVSKIEKRIYEAS